MYIKLLKMILSSALFLALFWPGHIYAGYIEGIDTTDANGYGLDSAFQVKNISISGKYLAYYYCNFYNCSSLGNLYNYSFDEIKKAPDSNLCQIPAYKIALLNFNYSYVIKKADSSFSKFTILQKNNDGRYVFKFGSNTVPNNRLLEKSDYDRSILYKPNNFRRFSVMFSVLYPGIPNTWGLGQIATDFYWDAPLPNNNHLLGYALYFPKRAVVIDTSMPIDLAQWDSTPLITATYFRDGGVHMTYDSITHVTSVMFDSNLYHPGNDHYNLVAVYQEGRSDFLKGWSVEEVPVRTFKNPPGKKAPVQNSLIVKSGTVVTFQCRFSGDYSTPAALAIFTLKGERLASFNIPQTSTVFWTPSHTKVCKGLYIVKAEFPDHTILTQPFLFTK
jgi:hypothetical protein